MFGKGQHGDAVIVARATHEGQYRRGINSYAPTGLYHHVYDYIADVTPEDGGETFRARFVEMFESDTDRRPLPTEHARVKIGKNNEVEFDRKALWEEQKAIKNGSHNSFDAIANATPGTAPFAAPVVTPRVTTPVTKPAAADDTIDQLARLAELKDRGILTDAEFAAQKAKLLT